MKAASGLRGRLPAVDVEYVLDRAGVPRDTRGIVLGCGLAFEAGVGVVALLNSDPLGWAYLAAAVGGYAFLQTRFVPAVLWLLAAAAGVWGVVAGAPGAWVEVFFGLVLAAVAALAEPDPDFWLDDLEPPPTSSSRSAEKPQPSLNQSSAPAEEPQANLSQSSSPAQETGRPAIVIRTIGQLQVVIDGHNVTGRILDKRTICGLWCYLLTLALRNPDIPIKRSLLATQLSPGLPRRQQRDRLRRQLWDLQHDLGAELGALVITDRSSVLFDLGAADLDATQLQRVCTELEAGAVGADELLAEARRILDESPSPRFLPDFERLAAEAGIDAVPARRAVTEVRTQINHLRSDLRRLLEKQRVGSSALSKGVLS